jgi:hypothetical protein
MSYPIFLVRGKQNKGSDIVCELLQKKKILQQFVKLIFLDNREIAERAQIKGVPALKNENSIIYGSQIITFLETLANKSQGVKEGSVGGSDFVYLDDDNTVSFDPGTIKSEQDFVIPSNPIGNNDIDIELARQQALREAFDEENKFNARR